MTTIIAPGSTFVIQVTDPASPSTVTGYAFVEVTRFVPVTATGKSGQVFTGAKALFADKGKTKTLPAIALPGTQPTAMRFHADFGSGDPS